MHQLEIAMSKKIEIELVKSVIGTPQWMRVIVRTMGLGKKINSKRVHVDSPSIRGMVNKVPHLVKVREVEA